MDRKHIVILLLAISAGCAIAKPYYYFQQEIPEAVNDAAGKVEQAAIQAKEAISGQSGELNQRIHGHLNQLYSHGSSAVKSVVDTVQPDLSNIGKDIKDVYHVTRDNVGKKIEPLAQTVRPYIDHAQKVVAPYVNQAKEEVPKLINQVGEQVRDRITGVWDKLTTATHKGAQDVTSNVQQAGEKVQQAATNAIQQSAETVKQAGQQAKEAV